jgi:hypothetical protein
MTDTDDEEGVELLSAAPAEHKTLDNTRLPGPLHQMQDKPTSVLVLKLIATGKPGPTLRARRLKIRQSDN